MLKSKVMLLERVDIECVEVLTNDNSIPQIV